METYAFRVVAVRSFLFPTKSRFYILIPLVASLWFIVAVAHAQSLEIVDNTYEIPILKRTGHSYHLIYKVSPKRTDLSTKRKIVSAKEHLPSNSTFRLIDFDTLLHVYDTTVITMAGNNRLLSYTNDGRVSYALFNTKNGPMLYTSHGATHELHFTALNIPKLKPMKHFQFGLISAINDHGVYLYRQLNNHQTEVVRYNGEGIKVWSKMFSTNDLSFTLQFMANAKHLMVIQKRYPIKKNKLLALYILDANSGEEISTTDYTKGTESFSVDNFFIQSDTNVLITGRAFPGNEVSQYKTGRPYIISHTDKGNAHEIDFDRSPLMINKFMWETISFGSTGQAFLVGETFTSGSLGGYIAKMVLASPLILLEAMFPPYTSNSLILSLADKTKITFEGVVYMPVSESSEINTPKFYYLLPKTYKQRGFHHTYPLAQLAPNRLIGSSHAGQVYFKENNGLKELDLNVFRFKTAPIDLNGRPVFFSKDYSIQMSTSIYNNSYLLKVVR
jgi:hypothetical protein